MRKHAFCICKTKAHFSCAKLCHNHAGDQHLCFRCIDSTLTLLPSVAVHSGLCLTASESSKTGFIMMWLKLPIPVHSKNAKIP